MAAVFRTVMIGRLLVSLCPVNRKLVVYLGYCVEVVHRVVRGVGVSLFNFPAST